MTKRMYCKISLFVATAILISSFLSTTVFASIDPDSGLLDEVSETSSLLETTEAVNTGELLSNNTFDGSVLNPWNLVVSSPARAEYYSENGKCKIKITDKGINRWDISFKYKNLTIEKEHTYTVKYTIESDKDTQFYPKIGQSGDPYEEYYRPADWLPLKLKANTPLTVTDTFTMTKETQRNCEFGFYIAGDCIPQSQNPPVTITFDDIYLSDPQYTKPVPPLPEPTNGIRVNQEGYFPRLSKVATLVSDSTTPVDWELKNSEGITVATGKTTVKGFDKSSGDDVHIIDFSSYTTMGTGFKLVSGTSESMPFDIRNDLYSTMKYNALKYFYFHRSGIEIKMPYCEQEEWARPVGHPKDIVTPDKGMDYKEEYSLDVTGGWYEAGDYGKYVVYGGVATWTLMNQYERALILGGDLKSVPYADGSLNIPESNNGIPDILDETRWNLQTLLNMQVPSGTLKGMVHHKAHDERWVSLAVRPDQDIQPRWLYTPTTAATLNLAAIAAQGSRLWKLYDATFSDKCLTAAETAWDAAVAHPDRYPYILGMNYDFNGDNVSDEFYWAACELYATTGKAKYLDYIKTSRQYLKAYTEVGENYNKQYFDWENTVALGTITLVLVPNGLPANDISTAKANIIKVADEFVATANSQGYGLPIREGHIDAYGLVGFPHASNNLVVNGAIAMAYAYDISKDIKYLNGLTGAMDYILGRNPNVQSYVTGYGENPLENPHHRFWSYQCDQTFPKPPPGCLASGPNSGLSDSWVRGEGWKVGVRPAEKCFSDNIESWSTNEININLNASLAWVSAYLDENGPEKVIVPKKTGDINGDDTIDALDLAVFRAYLLGRITKLSVDDAEIVADLNKDGSIDALDYALLKKSLLQS